jgi:hypothetical protein
MSYKEKYFKYKNKYFNLKKMNQKAGNDKYLKFIEDGINNNIQINTLFEILLVYENYRPAYLKYFNIYKNPEEKYKILTQLILKHLNDKEWKFTKEPDDINYYIKKVNGYGRIFFHINNLTKKKENQNNDDWVGINLGFKCLNFNKVKELNENYSIQFYLIFNDNKYNLNSQLCEDSESNKEHFEKILKNFNIVAKKINGIVIKKVHKIYSDIKLLHKWILNDIDISDEDLMMQIISPFNEDLKNTNTLNLINDIDYLIKAYDFVLLSLLLRIYDVFIILKEEPKLDFELNKNPINSYLERILDFNLNNLDKDELVEFNYRNNLLIYNYNKLKEISNLFKNNHKQIDNSKEILGKISLFDPIYY